MDAVLVRLLTDSGPRWFRGDPELKAARREQRDCRDAPDSGMRRPSDGPAGLDNSVAVPKAPGLADP